MKWGVKKTQPGPGSTQRNGLRRSCYEVGGEPTGLQINHRTAR